MSRDREDAVVDANIDRQIKELRDSFGHQPDWMQNKQFDSGDKIALPKIKGGYTVCASGNEVVSYTADSLGLK